MNNFHIKGNYHQKEVIPRPVIFNSHDIIVEAHKMHMNEKVMAGEGTVSAYSMLSGWSNKSFIWRPALSKCEIRTRTIDFNVDINSLLMHLRSMPKITNEKQWKIEVG